jgi:hypothetical protein
MRWNALPVLIALAIQAASGLHAQAVPLNQDSLRADRDKHIGAVRERIKGKENLPGDSVYKGLKALGRVPAERLPMIMGRFSEALGVSCDHCHVVDEWDKEDRKPKQITRDMMAMARTINDSLLGKIKNLKSERPSVGCATCHRGAVKPATSMQ